MDEKYNLRLQHALEAFEDYEKFGKSKECRNYGDIMNRLRVIPCGIKHSKKGMKEFKDFIPQEERVGRSNLYLTKLVLDIYVSYISDSDSEEYMKLYRKRYYEMNKEKLQEICRISNRVRHKMNRDKELNRIRSWQKNNPEKFRASVAKYEDKLKTLNPEKWQYRIEWKKEYSKQRDKVLKLYSGKSLKDKKKRSVILAEIMAEWKNLRQKVSE